ncbi:MAG: hypothetical protein K2Q45_09425 [Nitrosomonas sp.]|nr:hypothetical protein [Nitrosomonas sp.]
MKNLKPLILSLISLIAGLNLIQNSFANSSVSNVPEDGVIPQRVELDQGWDKEIRQLFWFTSQGSRIIPYNWFMWLEQANNNNLFRNVDYMEMLRYLPMRSSEKNPAGLPIGFALDQDKKTGEAWVGLTCAACHTNQIDYKGTRMLIEGAPTLANFVKFFSDLVDALDKTNNNTEKFTRFAKKVLGSEYSEINANELHKELAETTFKLAQRSNVNDLPAGYPTDFTSYGRLDAFGNIQNAASAFALHDLSNKNAPTAPVSYPFLWGTHQSNVVQWNGSAPNTPVIGPLVRNIGEVVGVFGDLDMREAPWWRKLLHQKVEYSATVNLHNLGELELWVKQLRSPDWSDKNINLPPVDMVKSAKGSILYKQLCNNCHEVIPRDQQGNKYKANMTSLAEVGTDPTMAINADYHMAKTLLLEGTKTSILFGDKFAETAPAIELAVNGVIGLVLKDPIKAIEAGLISELDYSKKEHKAELKNAMEKQLKDFKSGADSMKDLLEKYIKERKAAKKSGLSVSNTPDLNKLAYKARPLNGIWATAPYLHNGSVPNLWELLKKPEDRITEFWVGNREFDPVNVGFDINQGLSKFSVYESGTKNIMPGNSNRGHHYGTDLTDDDKRSLIEYMKTL